MAAKRKSLFEGSREKHEHPPRRDVLYERELSKLQLANQIARLREAAGLSQAELARRIGTQQAGVARMERSTYRGYTVGTLAKIAAATRSRLEVRLIPGSAAGRHPSSANGVRARRGRS